MIAKVIPIYFRFINSQKVNCPFQKYWREEDTNAKQKKIKLILADNLIHVLRDSSIKPSIAKTLIKPNTHIATKTIGILHPLIFVYTFKS